VKGGSELLIPCTGFLPKFVPHLITFGEFKEGMFNLEEIKKKLKTEK
jgi:hypothetical protein